MAQQQQRNKNRSGDWKKKDGSAGRSVGDFTNEDGYWKLLIDRRMCDREGKYQDITPIDSEGFRGDMIDPAKTADRFHVTEVADEEWARRVVDAVQESERERLDDTDAAVDYGWRLSEKVTGKRAKGEEIIEFPPVGGRRYSLSGEARRVLEDEASTTMQRAATRAVLNREERRESDRDRISLDEVRESGATVDNGEGVRGDASQKETTSADGKRHYSLNGGARRWWGEREEALRSEYDALAQQARPLRRARQEGTAYSPNELAAIDRQMRALRGKIDLVNKVNDLLDNAAARPKRVAPPICYLSTVICNP